MPSWHAYTSVAVSSVTFGVSRCSQRRRDLSGLPKAQLHLHFGPACLRRDTLRFLSASPHFEEQRRLSLIDAVKQAETGEANGQKRYATKYWRRATLLSANDIIAAGFGPAPPPPDASEDTVLKDIKRMDNELHQPGAVGIWDQQWLARQLVASDPVGAETRCLKELYEDAETEGIAWVEICAGMNVKDGHVDATQMALWEVRLSAWAELERQYAGRVGLRFVINCPKTAADAAVLMKFLHAVDRGGAVVGVGQWGREASVTSRREAFAVCRDSGLVAVCVHAGEHALQAACPDGAEIDAARLAAYNGPANVRDAVEVARARRVGHGIEAIKDPLLMACLASTTASTTGGGEGGGAVSCALISKQAPPVCLEVCLLSNRRLGFCDSGLATHPLPTLMGAGVACCLASDDPAFFGAHTSHGLVREYVAARHLVGLDDEALAELARASFRHSCAPPEVVNRGLAGIDAWLRDA